MGEDFNRFAAEHDGRDASTSMRRHCDQVASTLISHINDDLIWSIAFKLYHFACDAVVLRLHLDVGQDA